MKKNLLLIALTMLASTVFAQDTLTGWTFPANSGPDSLNANLGTTQNQGYDLRFQWVLTATTDSTLETVYFESGNTTYCAATGQWNDGADVKFWSIKFKAANSSNFKVSSKQRSGSIPNPGPRDFKLQWRLSSGVFADIDGGTVTVADDWTTGEVSKLPFPASNTGTSSVYIRWIMTSNTDINGGTVGAAGVSGIDDILVTGTSTLGTHDILYTNRLSVSPNPNRGVFTVTSTEPMHEIYILNIAGQVVRHVSNPAMAVPFDLNGESKGVYFLRVKFADNDAFSTSKMIIE